MTSLERDNVKKIAANSTKPAAMRPVLVRRPVQGVVSDQGSAPPANTAGTNHTGCSRWNDALPRRSKVSSMNA